jgi:hypothetical protein
VTPPSKRQPSLIWLVHALMIAVGIAWIGGNTWFAAFQVEANMTINIAFITVGGMAAITLLALAVLYKIGTRAGNGWLLAGLGLTVWAAGDLVYILLEIVGNPPYPSVADILYLVAYLPIATGLVMLAVLFKQHLGRKDGFAAVALLSVAACVVVAFVMIPAINQLRIDGDVAGQVMGFLYPAFDIVLLACVITVAAKIRRGEISRAWFHILAGFSLMGVGDVLYWVAYTNQTFVLFNFHDFLYLCTYLLLIAGGLRIRQIVSVSSQQRAS